MEIHTAEGVAEKDRNNLMRQGRRELKEHMDCAQLLKMGIPEG